LEEYSTDDNEKKYIKEEIHKINEHSLINGIMHYGQNNGGLNQRVNNPMFRPLPTFNNGLRPAFLSSMNPNVKYVFLKKGEVAP